MDESATTEECIREREASRTRALVEADVATLERLCDPELVYTHSVGFRDTRLHHLESVRSGTIVYHRVDHEIAQIVHVEDMAWGYGVLRAAMTAGGREMQTRSLTTMVWIRRVDTWRLLSFQATVEQDRPS